MICILASLYRMFSSYFFDDPNPSFSGFDTDSIQMHTFLDVVHVMRRLYSNTQRKQRR
jgi:hypothetical protein